MSRYLPDLQRPEFREAAEINRTDAIAAIVKAIDKNLIHDALRPPNPALWGNHILEFGNEDQIMAFVRAGGRLLPNALMRGRKRLADHLVECTDQPPTGKNLAAIARICLAARCGIEFDDKALGQVPQSRQRQIQSALRLLKGRQRQKISPEAQTRLAEMVMRIKTLPLSEPE